MDSFSKQYFKHDLYSRNDPKLLEILMVHGLSGLGFWWCTLEILYEQNNRIEVKQCASIAYALHMDMQQHTELMQFFCSIGLLQCDNDCYSSESVSKRITETMKVWNEKSEKAKKAAYSRWNRTSEQSHSTSNADAMQVQSETMLVDKNRIDKNNKKRIIKRERELLLSLFSKSGFEDHLDRFIEKVESMDQLFDLQSYARKYIENLQSAPVVSQSRRKHNATSKQAATRIDDLESVVNTAIAIRRKPK